MAVNMVETVPYEEDNEVGIAPPQSVPIPTGAAASTMPVQSGGGGGGGGAMDSMITDFLIRKFGGQGVQGANAPAPMSLPPPAVGAPSSPVARQALEPMTPPPPSPDIPPTLTPALPPTPMSNAASNAPMPRPRPSNAPIGVPSPTTGSANAAPMAPTPQPPGPMIRPGSYADIAFNALRSAFTSGPNGASGSANAAPVGPPIPPSAGANVPMPRPRPGSAPPPPPTTGSANAAYEGSSGGNPYSAMMPSWRPASMQPAEDPNRPAYGGKSALSGILTGTSPYATPAEAASKPDSVLDKVMTYIKNRGSSGSANAAAGGGKETTGDELAARRQGQKVGPPQLESLPKGASSRYTRPYAKGGVKEGQKRPMPKQKQQAPRASAARSQPQPSSRGAPSQKRAGAAPQTARGGRSAYAQSLIDSMGPRGQGVTTYIEPSTGNEILTGNGIYQNLGKTSTGTQKPSYTKFFDR